VISTIFALFSTPKPTNLCYCWFQIRSCQFHSHRHFFSQYPSSSISMSRYSRNYQHHLSSKFTSLASNSANLVHRSLHNAGPHYLSSLLHPYTPSRQLRSTSLNLLSQPRVNFILASRGFRHADPSLWNSLPRHLRYTDSYTVFRANLKTHLFSAASISGPQQFLSPHY